MLTVLRRVGLVVLLSSFGHAFAAGQAARLIVNCLPRTFPPASTHCFDATVGKPVTAYVVAADAGFDIVTNYAGTVHITSSDPTATLPPDHTYTPADAGVFAFQVTFHSVTSTEIPSPEKIYAADVGNPLAGLQIFSVFLPVRPMPTPALGISSLLFLGGALVVVGLSAIRNARL